jgi:hypothetical protein
VPRWLVVDLARLGQDVLGYMHMTGRNIMSLLIATIMPAPTSSALLTAPRLPHHKRANCRQESSPLFAASNSNLQTPTSTSSLPMREKNTDIIEQNRLDTRPPPPELPSASREQVRLGRIRALSSPGRPALDPGSIFQSFFDKSYRFLSDLYAHPSNPNPTRIHFSSYCIIPRADSAPTPAADLAPTRLR